MDSKIVSPHHTIAEILQAVYEYLSNDPRVLRPGSIRAYEAAIADIYFRLLLEGEIDDQKFRQIVTRVGIQNLLSSVETQSPEEKKTILEEAFEYALNKVLNRIESEVREASRGEKQELSDKGKREKDESQGRDVASTGKRELERNLQKRRSSGHGMQSSAAQPMGLSYYTDMFLQFQDVKLTRQGVDRLGKSTQQASTPHLSKEIVDVEVQEVAEDQELEQMISTIYEAFYGGVGTVNFMNLAQLINMFVRYDANIVKKAQVLKKLEKYLRSYGLVPQTTFTRLASGERKVFEEFRRRVRGQSPDVSQMKVMKFVGSDRYPTYVVTMREYKFGDSYSNIDVYKTAINISRKALMGKYITSRDIIVKEYASVKSIDLVLCLDVSGSMRELSWGVQKIEIAKDAVSKYVQFLMNTNDKLALILFNFRADVLWTLHQVKKYWKYMLYLLSYVYAGGGTNLAHALERAREVLSKSKSTAKHVVCVTDGRTVNAQLCIRETIRLRRQGATVSTIAIGENSDDDLLMKISRIGGGLFIKISNIHDLSRALILDKLHFL